ncbi:hypothetical protein DID88_003598 [Monilinia fructigena]|uniref:Uncharacterized protein n=1 Tax=Monilinia fructigena TaxID=38457 RepID=A0A395IUN2_9HELO|nr:hypothetical protein DID88_003598 [Monilinia fructigena]
MIREGGGRGGGRGHGEHRGGRGGGRGGHGGERGGHGGGNSEKPKKENILDLGKYMDKQITVQIQWWQRRLTDDEGKEAWRPLGLVVARGTLLIGISPVDGSEE